MALPCTEMGSWAVWLDGLLMTGPLSWFGIAPWSTGDGFGLTSWLLHQARIGRKVVRAVFPTMTDGGSVASILLSSDKAKILALDESLMWYGTQGSSLDYGSNF